MLAGEAARDSPPAALEALAITVRTFALANRGRHRADSFDLATRRTAGSEDGNGRDRACGDGNRRPRAAARWRARFCLLLGVVRRTNRNSSAVWPGAEDPPFFRRVQTTPAAAGRSGQRRSANWISSGPFEPPVFAAIACATRAS